MKDEKPSGQVIPEILSRLITEYHMSALNYGHNNAASSLVEAEAAINAHFVSVLEELKNDIDTVQPESDYYAEAIAAVIAKYKKGGNHEKPRTI